MFSNNLHFDFTVAGLELVLTVAGAVGADAEVFAVADVALAAGAANGFR